MIRNLKIFIMVQQFKNEIKIDIGELAKYILQNDISKVKELINPLNLFLQAQITKYVQEISQQISLDELNQISRINEFRHYLKSRYFNGDIPGFDKFNKIIGVLIDVENCLNSFESIDEREYHKLFQNKYVEIF